MVYDITKKDILYCGDANELTLSTHSLVPLSSFPLDFQWLIGCFGSL